MLRYAAQLFESRLQDNKLAEEVNLCYIIK